jgi:succinoglycan biosynthesis protein ExoM
MGSSIRIDVCIATFKRPQMLASLLQSLAQQKLDGMIIRIIVVDNDREQSAMPAVAAFRYAYKIDVIYDVEPVQNIALSRNRAMEHVTSEFFAFVDDDEIVSDRWLQSHLDCLMSHQADLVFGPVRSTLPNDAPGWAGRCFKKIQRSTGDVLEFGGAGNVFARRSAFELPSARFDPAFGLTGGEDTDLFYRLSMAGKRLIWCEEAWASEPVPSARLTLKWVRRREFRSGQTYYKIFVTRYSMRQKAAWFVTKLMQLAGGILIAPMMRLISYPSYVVLTARVASATGQLSSCFSKKIVEEYGLRYYQ